MYNRVTKISFQGTNLIIRNQILLSYIEMQNLPEYYSNKVNSVETRLPIKDVSRCVTWL